ncbi:hypothetical protein [Streptomyces sp. NPDC005498]|uniref:hypothetical protein n=1 Tax=Streptomyces sp. NPDC005498 TaxID=3364717 RepID=UPI003690D9ED
MDTLATNNEAAEALVGLALATFVDTQHRERAERDADRSRRRTYVRDAARWKAVDLFGNGPAEQLGWHVTESEDTPDGIAEATVVLTSAGPTLAALVFRSEDSDPETMADSGALYFKRDCFTCGLGHVDAVDTLARLGELLTAHSNYDTDTDHSPAPDPDSAHWPLSVTGSK